MLAAAYPGLIPLLFLSNFFLDPGVQNMAKPGTKKKPAVVRVRTEKRLQEVASIFEKHGWKFIIGLEPDKPENISDLERLLSPVLPKKTDQKIGRNDPCPCGSGKKYKKCCGKLFRVKISRHIGIGRRLTEPPSHTTLRTGPYRAVSPSQRLWRNKSAGQAK